MMIGRAYEAIGSMIAEAEIASTQELLQRTFNPASEKQAAFIRKKTRAFAANYEALIARQTELQLLLITMEGTFIVNNLLIALPLLCVLALPFYLVATHFKLRYDDHFKELDDLVKLGTWCSKELGASVVTQPLFRDLCTVLQKHVRPDDLPFLSVVRETQGFEKAATNYLAFAFFCYKPTPVKSLTYDAVMQVKEMGFSNVTRDVLEEVIFQGLQPVKKT